jgi:mannose-6-phosphate isomerase-like protein (cupin superfamily)
MPILVSTPGTRNLDEVRTDAPRKATQNSKWEVLQREDPYVHIAQVNPGSHVDAHSHSTSEVMIILEGSVKVGDTDCTAGSIAIIPAHEVYSLDVGEQGVTFAVVRPTTARFEER